MEIKGHHLIAGVCVAGTSTTFTATNPATGGAMTPAFSEATAADVDRAMNAAAEAFVSYRRLPGARVAEFLEAVAAEIADLGDGLLERAHLETALPMARLTGERARTLNTFKIFAAMARDGSWLNARIDRADPDRKPLPKPDVRAANIGIGPVVVFGASNFPLAISVAGTDTVAALAAGCPVVVKAHPAHPGTSEIVGNCFARVAARLGLPPGVFSLLHGVGHEVGLALVRHPQTRAVAFTGSLRGGRALFDAGAARPDPIPVYAEMGSVNPVIIFPHAAAERGAAIASAYVQSVTLGVGQFCTNPGLVLGLDNADLDGFITAAASEARKVAPATMLTPGIARAFTTAVDRHNKTPGVTVAGRSETAAEPAKSQADCVIFSTNAATARAQHHLADEIFGPTSTVVRCRDRAELAAFVRDLQGHLVASVHATAADIAENGDILAQLETKVGRIVWNGFGTGIEVCAAMHHSGPYPATSDPHFTSIGHAAISRFARPVAYQGYPDNALPEALRNRNTLGVWRLVDGQMTRDDVPGGHPI